MAEEKVALPITKYYVSADVKNKLGGIASGPGYSNDVSQWIKSLESTGTLTDADLSGVSRETIEPIIKGVKKFREGLQEQLQKYKTRESQLTTPEVQDYLAHLEAAGTKPDDFDVQAGQSRENFKKSVIDKLTSKVNDPGKVEELAEKAAQRFITEGRTGEQSLVDFLAQEGNLDNAMVRGAIGSLNTNQEILGFMPETQYDYNNEITRINGLLTTKQTADREKTRQDAQIGLAGSQRDQALGLFQQASDALGQPIPTFTPELNEAMLQQIQNSILSQGNLAMQGTEARLANRGLTGSTTEAFALNDTDKNVADTFANATLQFLMQSGQSAAQNRQFLVSSLMNQAQSLLGASQQTESLVTGREGNANQLDLARNQLQAQIDQFNRTFSENQRQFQDNFNFQKEQAGSNMALLMQQLSQPKGGGSPLSSLGAFGGMGLGAALAAPTGGMSIPVGMALGGAGGGFLGGLGDLFGGGK